MSSLVLMFMSMLIGIALRRYGRVPDNAPATIDGLSLTSQCLHSHCCKFTA